MKFYLHNRKRCFERFKIVPQLSCAMESANVYYTIAFTWFWWTAMFRFKVK